MCNITINIAEKRSDSIFLQGTSNCGNVSVSINIAGVSVQAQIAEVGLDGTWKIEFTFDDFPDLESTQCPQHIKTAISCVDNTTCVSPSGVILTCGGATCPAVSVQATDISSCDDNGQRTVTFDIDIGNAPNPTILEIDYGDGTDENIQNSEIQNSDGSTITKDHTYASGNYTVVVDTTYPEGCQSPDPVSIDVPICDSACPDDVEFEIIDGSGNRFRVLDNISGSYQQINDNPDGNQIDCLQSGDYTVRLTQPSGMLQSITWREDGNSPTTSNQSDFNVHLGSGDQKAISVVVIKQDDCTPLPETVVLKACGCEKTDWSEWSECENCIQTRERTLVDCSKEKESKKCKNKKTNWSDSVSSMFCTIFRTRRDEDCNEITTNITSWCCIWLYINIFLTAATIISLIIAGCVLQWVEPISMSIAITLVSVTLLSWLLWGVFCLILKRDKPVISCAMLLKTIDILDWAESLSGILAIVFAVIGLLPCAMSFAISWGLVAMVKKYLVSIARFINCMPNPWFRSQN